MADPAERWLSITDTSSHREPGASLAIEVRVYHGGRLIDTRLCGSDAEADEFTGGWAAEAGVTCAVADLSFQRNSGELREAGRTQTRETG
jgi:hypothetical protein